jgi:ABC-type Na+ efflux pump permease subunit
VLVDAGFVELRKTSLSTRIREETGSTTEAALFSPNVVNVERTAAGTRSITSQVIPGLVCLQAGLLVAGTANRLVSRRTRGLLMAQLLLPVSRRNLALAKGLGELGIGSLTSVPVALGVLAFLGLTTTHFGSALDALVFVIVTLITMLACFALTTTIGVWVGTAARTQEQVSLATGGAIVLATVVAATIALSNSPSGPFFLSFVPFAGSIAALRDVLNGAGNVVAIAISTASTLLGAFAITMRAGRSLDAERMVVRNG